MYMYSYSFSPNEHYTKDSNLLKKASQQTFHSHHKYDRTDFDGKFTHICPLPSTLK